MADLTAISGTHNSPIFLLDPANGPFVEATSNKRLPGLFRTRKNRLLALAIFLFVTAASVALALEGWRTAVMLSAPSGLRRDAQVSDLRVDDNEGKVYRVSYRFAPYGDDRLIEGRDFVAKRFYEQLKRGGVIPICYASSEPALSKALPNCEDTPLVVSGFVITWVAAFLFVFLKDACLRRGRLVPGQIVAVDGVRGEEKTFILIVKYRLVTPGGRVLSGGARCSRTDLGEDLSGLPLPDTPLLVQYAYPFHRPL